MDDELERDTYLTRRRIAIHWLHTSNVGILLSIVVVLAVTIWFWH